MIRGLVSAIKALARERVGAVASTGPGYRRGRRSRKADRSSAWRSPGPASPYGSRPAYDEYVVSNVRISPNAYRKVVMGAGIMLAVIVVSGAAVRLTSSGLGCEDWPTCTEDSLAPEWSFHAWVEFGNRLFTGVVSAAVIAAVLAANFRTPRDRRLVLLAGGLVLGVLAQILVGAAVVLLELSPVSVTAHFLISMILLANAVVLYRASSTDHHTPTAPGLPPWARFGHLALAAAVLISGTVVTGTGPNSGDVRANRLPFDLGAVARVHSLIVWAFLAGTVALAVALRGVPVLRRTMQVLVIAVLTQGAIGYAQYFNGVPPLLVQLHVTGSIVVWCASVWFFLVSEGVDTTGQPHPGATAAPLATSGARP